MSIPIGDVAGDWSVAEQKTAAKPSAGSTQRVIADKCEYARERLIPGAPKVPMSPKTAKDHPEMYVAAQRKIRKHVCTTMRSWPVCGPTQRNIDIDFQFDVDNDLGPILVGYFVCDACSRK